MLTAVVVTVPYALIQVGAGMLDGSTPLETVALFLVLGMSALLFVVPLRGMHRRLVVLKSQRLAATDRRFEHAAERLHAEIDAADPVELQAVGATMSGLALERGRVEHISTWPWSAATLRGFLSSIALPVLIWAFTTAVDIARVPG